MRPLRVIFTLTLTLVFCPTLIGQQSPQKDAQAMAVLARMVAATGWNALAVPRDVIGSGTVTRFIGDSKDTVGITIKVKGPRRYRAEVTESSGVTSTIVDAGRAAVLAPGGTRIIASHAALSMRPMAFPFLTDLAAFAESQIGIKYLGTELAGGELTHRLDIDRESAPGDPAAEIRRRAGHLTVWISASSGLVVQIEYVRISQDNSLATINRVRTFSDYRVVGGLAVPFRQEESVQGRVLYALQLTDVRFNAGLSDADFTFPGGQD